MYYDVGANVIPFYCFICKFDVQFLCVRESQFQCLASCWCRLLFYFIMVSYYGMLCVCFLEADVHFKCYVFFIFCPLNFIIIDLNVK